eukprot:5251153-Pyramimonas_sp.AAC.1
MDLLRAGRPRARLAAASQARALRLSPLCGGESYADRLKHIGEFALLGGVGGLNNCSGKGRGWRSR